MKGVALALLFGLTTGWLNAQTTFWTEDFGSGCNQGQLATAFSGSNGNWTVSNTGTNAGTANNWYISGAETNTGAGNCGAECGSNPNPTLHVSNQAVLTIPADIGAAYYEGLAGLCGLFPCGATDKRVESPTIDCTQFEAITLEFLYLEGGNNIDKATIWYFDGSNWSQIDDTPKTLNPTCAPQGQWTIRTIDLPESANENPNVKVGFRWVNNDDGDATDPSFAVDDITLSGTPVDNDVEPGECFGDFNNDGLINATDFSILINNFSCTGTCVADMNQDGLVNTEDLLEFLAVYGTSCD